MKQFLILWIAAVMIGAVLDIRPSLAANEPYSVTTTTETHVGDWQVGSVTFDAKSSECTLTNVVFSAVRVDEIKFTFLDPRFVTDPSMRVHVSINRTETGTKIRETATNRVDADGKVHRMKGVYGTRRVSMYHSMNVDEAFEILKSIGDVGANRRVTIIDDEAFFYPSLFEFDKALVLLKACVEKLG